MDKRTNVLRVIALVLLFSSGLMLSSLFLGGGTDNLISSIGTALSFCLTLWMLFMTFKDADKVLLFIVTLLAEAAAGLAYSGHFNPERCILITTAGLAIGSTAATATPKDTSLFSGFTHLLAPLWLAVFLIDRAYIALVVMKGELEQGWIMTTAASITLLIILCALLVITRSSTSKAFLHSCLACALLLTCGLDPVLQILNQEEALYTILFDIASDITLAGTLGVSFAAILIATDSNPVLASKLSPFIRIPFFNANTISNSMQQNALLAEQYIKSTTNLGTPQIQTQTPPLTQALPESPKRPEPDKTKNDANLKTLDNNSEKPTFLKQDPIPLKTESAPTQQPNSNTASELEEADSELSTTAIEAPDESFFDRLREMQNQ